MSDNNLFGNHVHHIVFRSHGGLDFALNHIVLSNEEHEGRYGPHKNRERDLELKRAMQESLLELFPDGKYDMDQISKRLGRTSRYFQKFFDKKNVPFEIAESCTGATKKVYASEDIVRMLMGGKLY